MISRRTSPFFLLLLGLPLFLPVARFVYGQEQPGFIRARASAEPGTLGFGDTIQYQIEVEWRGEYSVAEAVPPADLDQSFLVDSDLPPEVTQSPSGDSPGVWKKSYVLRAVHPGDTPIPPFSVQYFWGDEDTSGSVATPPVPVRVSPPPESSEVSGELRSVTPPESIPFDWTLRNLLLLGAALVLIAFGVSGWWLFRRLAARREGFKPVAPLRPAHEIAFEQLDWLERSTYLRDGRFKEFFTRLSEILRLYVQIRYGHPAMDWTSYEILEALRRDGEPGESLHCRLESVFDLCDLVKFSTWTPEPSQGDRGIEEARRFVLDTQPSIPAATEEAA